ncbi:MAG: hypothetical protein OZ921_08875 [Sorangiineae bacterium]|nr:hypothetical protein [Sorangiineae bacterium]
MGAGADVERDLLPLADALDAHRFGGKAAQLGALIRAGLPVPDGFGLDVGLVDRVAAGDRGASARCLEALERLGLPVAVRSSAVGEDSASASFAGQHLTRLAVATRAAVIEAIAEVRASGNAAGALAYRAHLGLAAEPRMGVVVQRMVDGECAGVMFTRCPLTGDDVRVIEAAWGLGESVVGGLCVPDRYRVARGGRVLERSIGEKEVAVRARPDGMTTEVDVLARDRARACLDEGHLLALDALARRCESLFDGSAAHDLEWAFANRELFLLQRRAVTRSSCSRGAAHSS